MLSLHKYLGTWTEAALFLEDGSSVMLTAPRYYSSQRLAGEVLKGLRAFHHIHLHTPDFIVDGRFSFEQAWAAAKKQSACPIKVRVKDRDDFELAVSKLIISRPEPVIFFLTGGGDGSEAYLFEIISSLDRICHALPFGESDRLRLLILDDYSLHYYEDKQAEHTSYGKLERLTQRPLGTAAIIRLLRHPELLAIVPEPTVDSAAERVLDLTGGHLGLTVGLLDHLRGHNSVVTEDFWLEPCRALLEGSSILQSIRRQLGEDQEGLTTVALRYATARPLLDFGRPDIQYLRRLGVIQTSSATRAILCPGLITELVRDLNESILEQQPVGTLVSELGPRRYDGRSEDLLAEESDLIALHISDLHLGENYPFRLPHLGPSANRKSLPEMVATDLDSLKLLKRVDFIVASGDFTQIARMDEFNRAREILLELADSIGVARDRIVVTAGNHDVDWKPSDLSRKEAVSGVSREHYETFRRLLGLEGSRISDLHSFPSRSGKTLLRVITLDSDFVEGPDAAGIGFVGEETFRQADRLLREQENSAYEFVHTWIVVHHHVFPASSLSLKEIQAAKLTMLANSSDLLAFANRNKAEMVLHGHEHQPSVTIARRWPSPLSRGFAPIIAVGAGSVSATRNELGPFSKNQYFLLYRKPDHIIIRSRAMGDTGLAFGPHDDLLVPF